MQPTETPPGHCVLIQESTNPDESGIYINSNRLLFTDGKPLRTFRQFPEADTLVKLIRYSMSKHPDIDMLGERSVLPDGTPGPYKFMSYRFVDKLTTDIAAAFESFGIQKGDRIGIYSPSCPQWQIMHFSAEKVGAIIVPVYDSLGTKAVSHIVEHSEIKVIFSHNFKLKETKDLLENAPQIEKIILLTEDSQQIESLGEKWMTYSQLVEKGRTINANNSFVPYEPVPGDIDCIMYTSGSTGVPKGCVLTHSNIIAGAAGIGEWGSQILENDTYLGFLPLAHIYAMCTDVIFLAQGTRIGYFRGRPQDIFPDAQALQPTIMLSVPRVYNKAYEAMLAKMSTMSPLKRWALSSAIKLKIDAIRNNRKHSQVLDWMIFGNFREMFGGKIRVLISGGSPITAEVMDFIRATVTPNLIQGYGLTEICASATVQEIYTPRNVASVGPINSSVNVKFRRVAGFNYDPKSPSPSGEILFNGPGVISSYYKDPKLTAENFKDGWFCSGDIGMIGVDGTLYIVDRIKQLVKLSQGEYISLTNLADIYSRTKGVLNLYIHANSFYNNPVALVVPTKDLISEWKTQGITDFQNDKRASDDMIRRLAQTSQANKLQGFERIIGVILDGTEWSTENGRLTPTSKPSFGEIKRLFEDKLNLLVQDIQTINKPHQ